MAVRDVPPPTPANHLVITITEAGGEHTGLRLRVTGFPSDEPYAGVLSPIREADVVKALRQFGE